MTRISPISTHAGMRESIFLVASLLFDSSLRTLVFGSSTRPVSIWPIGNLRSRGNVTACGAKDQQSYEEAHGGQRRRNTTARPRLATREGRVGHIRCQPR